MYLAIGGCVSNHLFREASARGIRLTAVRVVARGDFSGEPAVSEDVLYEVDIAGEASRERLGSWFRTWTHLNPNSIRRGTPVKLNTMRITPA
jgi:hypothetical protein